MVLPKTVGDFAEEQVEELFAGAEGSFVLTNCVEGAIAEKTKAAYANDVKKVGGYTPKHFVLFLHQELMRPIKPAELRKDPRRGKNRVFRYAASTMRAAKSACIHEALLKRQPWTQTQSNLLEFALAGYEAQGCSPSVRGALSPKQFEEYLELVRARGLDDLAEGAIVMRACGLRPRDVEQLCMDRCVVNEKQVVQRVWMEIKAPLAAKVRFGFMSPRLITTKEASEILQARFDAWAENGFDGDDPFFSGFTTKAVHDILQELCETRGWPEDVMYDGPHCFRHSMATDIMAHVMNEVQEAGDWKGDASPHVYTKGASGAGRAKASKAKQQKKAKAAKARSSKKR